MAVKNPDFVKLRLPNSGQIRLSLELTPKRLGRNRRLARNLWRRLYYSGTWNGKIGVRLFVYTDVDRDGTLTGPNFEHYEKLQAALTRAAVIASGGIAQLSDLTKLADIGVAGTIVGKAYYNGNVSLDELKEFWDVSKTHYSVFGC